ncbi:hypothetical protein PILCRDRAFT_602428 [Piloderma croceum F 1598]|uniref:Uncharacterized protein n=1 Tax=Piloderma croceum (strain F 1598) TaxID=765440 RepID=A0A0C3FDV5_PILCF|nr:hypothetical protein PILCRDRAFT_602428 [Piloderma croceum F 1598]
MCRFHWSAICSDDNGRNLCMRRQPAYSDPGFNLLSHCRSLRSRRVDFIPLFYKLPCCNGLCAVACGEHPSGHAAMSDGASYGRSRFREASSHRKIRYSMR